MKTNEQNTNKQKFITFEDCRIIYRNFSGKEGEFNRVGDRNFCVLLSDEVAAQFAEDGWNVKYLKPHEEGDAPQPYLQVKLKFNTERRPPRVVLVTSGGNTPLDASTVSLLDYAEITKVDLNIRPYNYDVRGNTGVSAYVRDIYVTIEEDELEKRYRNAPDSAMSSVVRFEEVED